MFSGILTVSVTVRPLLGLGIRKHGRTNIMTYIMRKQADDLFFKSITFTYGLNHDFPLLLTLICCFF